MSSLQYYAGTLRSLIGLQVVSRLTSFGLNQSLIRIASPTVYGTAAIQFDLVRDTVLFLGREAIRGVVLRAHVSDPRNQDEDSVRLNAGISSNRSQVLNLTLLAPLLGILVGLTVVPTYISLLPKETTFQSAYTVSLCGYLLATILELMVEPFLLGSQIGLFKRTSSDASAIRARIEGAGVVIRAAVTFACLFAATQTGNHDDHALLGFAAGQIAYSVVVIGGWTYATGYDVVIEVALQAKRMLRDGISLAFRKPLDAVLLESSQLHLLGALSGQSIIKHCLTEADRAVISWTSPLEDQAGYALASNYASLVVRIIFQPLEESARLYFSRTVQIGSAVQGHDTQPYRVLANILHLSLALPLITAAFSPPAGSILMPYLLPPKYLQTSAPSTLVAYMTLYLPIMSINGILEAFFSATTDTRKVARQSGVMAGCSLVFAGTLATARQFRESRTRHAASTSGVWLSPEISLVYANTLQMLCRIVFAGRHASDLTKIAIGSRFVLRWRPGMLSIAAIGTSGILVRAIPLLLGFGPVATLGVIAVCGISSLLCLAYDELPYWRALKARDHDKKKA